MQIHGGIKYFNGVQIYQNFLVRGVQIFQQNWNKLSGGPNILIYSKTSIIQTPVCHFYVKSVQVNEFVRMSELSDKIHYLASYIQ